MDRSFDLDELGALLNDAVQQSATRDEAEQVLNHRGPALIRVVADLNQIEFTADQPRKPTMIRAILDERFGK
jgi:hypothetical protein